MPQPSQLVADFDAESDLYERAGPLVSWLLASHLVSNSLEGTIGDGGGHVRDGFFHDRLDVDLAIASIKDL